MDSGAGRGARQEPQERSGADEFLTATFDEVAEAVRRAALQYELDNEQPRILVSLGLASVELFGGDVFGSFFGQTTHCLTLSPAGDEFDRVWTVHGDRVAAEAILRDAYLALPQTAALIQGLHGRHAVSVDGALHLLARHKLADSARVTEFRNFARVLSDFGIVAYSNKMQTIRVTANVPQQESDDAGAGPSVRVIERERPYSNVKHLRETLRACRGFIWWVDAHFSKRGLEPLVDEADATRITEIRILSGPAHVGADTAKDFKRFEQEMEALGITAEWRVVERADQDFHDRFIVSQGNAWNVPPINTLYQKGDYSEISVTKPPPFEMWWAKGKPLDRQA